MDSKTIAEQAADALKAKVRQQTLKPGMVSLPNAIQIPGKPFIEQRSKMHHKQSDIFEDATPLLKEPKEGYHYGWAKLGAPTTTMRVGEGLYRYVTPNEVNSRLADMFTTHKGVTGTMVCHGSLVLVEISPDGYVECYVEPEVEAIARLARQEESLRDDIERASGGDAVGTVESALEKE